MSETKTSGSDQPHDRRTDPDWFDAIYQNAEGNPQAVPWAELAPKWPLLEWLKAHPGTGQRALDIGCGLGDNAEALAAAGYQTTAFDVSPKAVQWARERFKGSGVDYRVEDLFQLSPDLIEAFDLVYECYTIQALHPDLRHHTIEAVASLVKPGGTLLVLPRMAASEERTGPPWPLLDSELSEFCRLGLKLHSRKDYTEDRPDGRQIPHSFLIYGKPVSAG